MALSPLTRRLADLYEDALMKAIEIGNEGAAEFYATEFWHLHRMLEEKDEEEEEQCPST